MAIGTGKQAFIDAITESGIIDLLEEIRDGIQALVEIMDTGSGE